MNTKIPLLEVGSFLKFTNYCNTEDGCDNPQYGEFGRILTFFSEYSRHSGRYQTFVTVATKCEYNPVKICVVKIEDLLRSAEIFPADSMAEVLFNG